MARNILEAFADAVANFGIRNPEVELGPEAAKQPRQRVTLQRTLERLFSKNCEPIHNLSTDGRLDFILYYECCTYKLKVLELDGPSVKVAKDPETGYLMMRGYFDIKQAAEDIELFPQYSGLLGKWRKL